MLPLSLTSETIYSAESKLPIHNPLPTKTHLITTPPVKPTSTPVKDASPCPPRPTICLPPHHLRQRRGALYSANLKLLCSSDGDTHCFNDVGFGNAGEED